MKGEGWEDSDLAISREVEQEVLDILDGRIPADFYTGLRQAKESRALPMEWVLKQRDRNIKTNGVARMFTGFNMKLVQALKMLKVSPLQKGSANKQIS